MTTLLILGSKPEPALPPRSSFEHLACANGSGYIASKYDLPTPVYTVMSAILTSVASGRQTLRVIRGLRTDTLYFFPRPEGPPRLFPRLIHHLQTIRMKPFFLRWKLKSLGYGYQEFIHRPHDYYAGLVRNLCDQDELVMSLVKRKQPSTGVIALLLGIDRGDYDRFILTGFSFELTHAYASNPEIDQRGTKSSKHADTDVAVINYLSNKFRNVFTTEPTVHARAEVPMLPSQS